MSPYVPHVDEKCRHKKQGGAEYKQRYDERNAYHVPSYTFKVIIFVIHTMPRPIMIKAAATSIFPVASVKRTLIYSGFMKDRAKAMKNGMPIRMAADSFPSAVNVRIFPLSLNRPLIKLLMFSR